VNRGCALNHESVQLGGLIDCGNGASGKVLLLVFTGDGVLVTEDEVNLNGGIRMCK
jgi:hypothetical protein